MTAPEKLDVFYRSLILDLERILLQGKPEAQKVGAWIRDTRIQRESAAPLPDQPALLDEMAEVLLSIHQRQYVSSADPLWGRIDEVARRLRS